MAMRSCTRCGCELSRLTLICPECGWLSEVYTDCARTAVVAANEWALNTANGGTSSMRIQQPRLFHEIRPVHLALGIVEGSAGVARHVLDQCGATGDELGASLLSLCPPIVHKNRDPDAKLVLSQQTKALAGEAAHRAAERSGHSWVGTEHLLLAILEHGPAKVIRCFSQHNARFENILEAVNRNNAGQTPMQPEEYSSPFRE